MAISLPVAIHVFVINKTKDKVLLIKRANTGFLDGYWSAPAGRLEEDESITNGARRELLEEVGLVTTLKNLGVPYTMNHKNEKGERIYFFFLCYEWEGLPVNNEPDKCDAVDWFNLNDLPDNIVPHVNFALKAMINSTGIAYSEYGFNKD